ncbi:citrate synthase family protein [Rubrivivax sp. JA1024]|nr:citrate synthase family protein [Rubrivivax sp. JA1024]
MTIYLSSKEAATRLGVSRQTLYAYVSRGLLRSQAKETHRESLYLASDVEKLALQRATGRRPKEIAKAALNWGTPVLESAITLIEHERMFYRGVDVLALAETHRLEDLAAHLWSCDRDAGFNAPAPTFPAAMLAVMDAYRGRRAEQALLPLFTVASDDDGTSLRQTSSRHLIEGCAAIVRTLAACLLGTIPDTAPIHQQCAAAWRVDREGAELIRMALVLCADHELNASSFTARCITSAGASLRAAVIGGLAALTGARHGATTARDEALWDDVGSSDIERKMRERIAQGLDIPGFGHPLYPGGDIRADALLRRIMPHHPEWQDFVKAAFTLTGQHPSVDFALVALRRHLNLPIGAAFGIFALGRSVGWLAHGLEQRNSPDIIRPRASYAGNRPTS